MVNKIIEKVNVLFSIDPPPASSNTYQQPSQAATNQQYITTQQQYQPNPTTIFHSFQQQQQYQFPQQNQNPFIPALQNQFAQPNIYAQPTYSPTSSQQLNNFPRPFTTNVPQTFVPSLGNYPSVQSQQSLSYPFNLQIPQALLLNQQYQQQRQSPASSAEQDESVYSTQQVQHLLSSLPANPHRLGPVGSHQTKPQTDKEDKVTTYKPPTLDIHRFITKQQSINKSKRNNNDNVQIVQSISYDQDHTFEPSGSDNHEVRVPDPGHSGNKDLTRGNENKIIRKIRKIRRTKATQKTDETETSKEEGDVELPNPYISDPKIELKQALIYDPVSRTYKEENLFYKQNSKGEYERYESKKSKDETINKNQSGERKRPNRRIYTEDIEEINQEYNKYLPEVNEKAQDISEEKSSNKEDSLSKRYVQNGYLDDRYNTHNKYNDGEAAYPGLDFKPVAVLKQTKKYEKGKNNAGIPNKKVQYYLKEYRNVVPKIPPTPIYEEEINPDEEVSYREQDHIKQNRQTGSEITGQSNFYNTQRPNYYDNEKQKSYKPPRVLTEEYFNARPTSRPHKFNDEGIIQKLPLEKVIDFNIPSNPVHNFPETSKPVAYYPNKVLGQDRTIGQYYEEPNKRKEVADKPNVANDDYNEPPTNTDYYDQPQRAQYDDYQQGIPVNNQDKPKLVLGYKSPSNTNNYAGPDPVKGTTYEPQSPKISADYYNQYSVPTEQYNDDRQRNTQFNEHTSPKPSAEQYKEQPTPQSYITRPSPLYNENLNPTTARYNQPTVAPADYYDEPKQHDEEPKSQPINYDEGYKGDVTDNQIKSTPESYYQDEIEKHQYEQPKYQQQKPVQSSAEIYPDNPKPNYDYYDNSQDIKTFDQNKLNNEKTKQALRDQYYSQFKTQEDEPSVSRPNGFQRYEVKDDIIKKYYYANDQSRVRPYNTESEPATSKEIEVSNFNKNKLNTETTPKYHFENQETPEYDIPTSAAMGNNVLFNVYKQKQIDQQDKNLQIQEQAHKEREQLIQRQVYENFKRQLAASTIPPAAVPHLKTPVNVEITSY